MGTKTRFSRRASGLMLGLGLLSLVFLGSPGCGCGSDDLDPNEDERPPRCCCDFEWLPPPNTIASAVVITVENEGTSLDATVTPSVLVDVIGREFEQFTVCINEEHLLGESLELVFTDQTTTTEYGRALLIYSKRCEPVIEPLTPEMNLVSTDCGEDTLRCCCEFEWSPGPNQVGDVTINAENVSAGLLPQITPSTLEGVAVRTVEIFEVCVAADHPLGASMDLVIRQQGTNVLLGMVQLDYDERCLPTIVFVTAAPTLAITSTECGGDPLPCCCLVDWLPGFNMSGDVTLTAENVSAGLTVDITPTTLIGIDPRTFETFEICVNQDHPLLATFDLVVTSTPGGVEFGRSHVTYREQCTPDFADIPGTPGLQLTSTNCGGPPLVCCCEFEWFAPLSTWNPPGGPWTASLESVAPSLEVATITPTSIDVSLQIPSSILFTVCVNPTHDPLATMDIVLRGATGLEFARLPLTYDLQCQPISGQSTGEGFWNNLCAPQ